MSGRAALFLDRDGVINEEIGYLHRFDQVRFVPGIVELLRTANRLGLFPCVVTNQAGIGRGLYTEAQFQTVMQRMGRALAAEGAALAAVYHCPYHPQHGLGEYRRESACRKPLPGMLLQAAAEHGLDLSRSTMVGDRCSDMAAGAAAGVPHLFLLRSEEVCEGLACRRIHSLEYVNQHLKAVYGTARTPALETGRDQRTAD